MGFNLGGVKVSYLACADNFVFLVGGVFCSNLGMELHPGKCLVMCLDPVGPLRRFKIVEGTLLSITSASVHQLQFGESDRYLVELFWNSGAERPEIDIVQHRLRSTPLKQQQKLIALITHLLPHYMYGLVLGGCSHQFLRSIDTKVRAGVRRWLKLPRDKPVG